MKANNSKKLNSVTSLRFFAMLSVFICHCSFLKEFVLIRSNESFWQKYSENFGSL